MSKKACDNWNLISGVACAYKPAGPSWQYVVTKLKKNISEGLNNLKTRPTKTYLDIDRSSNELSIKVGPSYADNILCAGPRYLKEDIEIRVPYPLGRLSSGVLVLCINGGYTLSKLLQKLSFTKCYHIKGILGQATRNFHIDEKVIARAKFGHVKRSFLEKYLASYQTAAYKRIFEEYGVPINSQEGYNFAVKGLYRPVWKGPCIIYSIKTVHFEPPNFTLEVQCINESQVYLMNLIHNLGVSLKSYATCTDIRCLRQGCFHLEQALIHHQWTLNDILDNVKSCWEIIEENYPKRVKYSPTVYTTKSSAG